MPVRSFVAERRQHFAHQAGAGPGIEDTAGRGRHITADEPGGDRGYQVPETEHVFFVVFGPLVVARRKLSGALRPVHTLQALPAF